MRWKNLSEWGPARLAADEWAPLSAEIAADDLDAVEQTLDELTGFMDFFREDLDGEPLSGVTDGQLAVVQQQSTDTCGRPVLRVATMRSTSTTVSSSRGTMRSVSSLPSGTFNHEP